MAIFIASTKSITRSSGQSAVASASYRAGCELEDKRYGKTHDYSKKSGVMSASIILPSSLADTKATIDRGELWNKAEFAEHRKDARVAREWLINLPHELNEQERKELAHQFAQILADRYGTIADCAIHRPTEKEIERGADPRNFHAHIMFTTRTAELGDNNKIMLTEKATIELSDKKRRSLGLERVSDEIKEVRKIWEETANDKLAERKIDLIDCRSYADQGKDIEPQFKMGSVATKLERNAYVKAKTEAKAEAEKKGIDFKGINFKDLKPVTVRGEINAMIAARNALVLKASNRIIFEKREINESINNTKLYIDRADERLRDTERFINKAERKLDTSEQWINTNSERARRSQQVVSDNEQSISKNTSRTSKAASANGDLTQRIDSTKQTINRVAEAIRKSDIEINRRVEQSTRPAPTPFDDNYRRAFLKRKGRLDQELDDANTEAERRRFGDAKRTTTLRNAKLILAGKLLTRHNEKNSLRSGYNDKSEDYPKKFDYRQVAMLNDFAQKIGINELSDDDLRDKQIKIADMLTFDVIKDNIQAISILRNNEKERGQYNTVIADYDAFISELDSSRAIENSELQRSLGRSDISRMTAQTLTATSYLESIKQYMTKDSTADECRKLAEEHLSETLRRTSKQYQLAYQGLKTLDSNESLQRHFTALESTREVFTTRYAEKLTDSDIKSLNDGLKVINQNVEVNKSISRPSPF